MKIIFDSVFILLIAFYTFRFIRLVVIMRKDIVFPLTEEDMATIRIFPLKPIALPFFSKQKVELSIYLLMIVFLTIMSSLAMRNPDINWTFYLLIALPLINSNNLFNVFAIVDGGIVRGVRFISWRRVTSFQFTQMEPNSRFYGYSDEVNSGYQLKVRTKFFSVSCMITSNETKEKVTDILNEMIDRQKKNK